MPKIKKSLEESKKVEYDEAMVDSVIAQVDEKIKNIEEAINENMNDGAIYSVLQYYLTKDTKMDELKNRLLNPSNCYEVLNKYKYLIMLVNTKTEKPIVPTKELFCAFLGISTSIYNDIVNDSASDLHEVFKLVEDYIVDTNLSEAQRGNVAANITKFRTQVSGVHGHSLVTRKEELVENVKNDRKSKEQLQRELELIKLEQANLKAMKKLK